MVAVMLSTVVPRYSSICCYSFALTVPQNCLAETFSQHQRDGGEEGRLQVPDRECSQHMREGLPRSRC